MGARATDAAIDPIELDPGIGAPTLAKRLGIPGLQPWQVAEFPLLWCCFERGDPLEVDRQPGERQNIEAILGDAFAAKRRRTDCRDPGSAVNDRSSAFCSPG